MRTTRLIIAGALALAGAVQAHDDTSRAKAETALPPEQRDWGIAGDPRKVRRTIAVGMSDAMRFAPSHILVHQGETIRFVVRNTGKLNHEFVVGTRHELDEHAALMAKFPDMEHDEAFMAHVGPGRRGQIVWQFNRAGDFDFACLVSGHYEAGMRGTIRVIPNSPGDSNGTNPK